MSRPKVLITHSEIPEAALELLKETCDLIICPELPFPSREDILKRVKGVDALFWFTKVRLDKDMINATGDNLKVVATMSSGRDHINTPELRKRGVQIGNTPEILSYAVAELAIGLLIAAARRFKEGQTAIMTDTWNACGPKWLVGREIRGSTVGIVGLGFIGFEVARRLSGFDVKRIIYTGHRRKFEDEDCDAHFVTHEELLQESDFIVICCPLTCETKHMFNDEAFSKMKKQAVLVNIGRGEVIDQDALVRALQEEKIWAAALDVTTPEPLPSTHPLANLKNCYLIPHLGSATSKTREEMAMLTARNIIAALEGKVMPAPL